MIVTRLNVSVKIMVATNLQLCHPHVSSPSLASLVFTTAPGPRATSGPTSREVLISVGVFIIKVRKKVLRRSPTHFFLYHTIIYVPWSQSNHWENEAVSMTHT